MSLGLELGRESGTWAMTGARDLSLSVDVCVVVGGARVLSSGPRSCPGLPSQLRSEGQEPLSLRRDLSLTLQTLVRVIFTSVIFY